MSIRICTCQYPGVSPDIAEEYLNKLENSKREPKARMIIRLGRGLGVSPGDLLNEMDRLMRLEEDE